MAKTQPVEAAFIFHKQPKSLREHVNHITKGKCSGCKGCIEICEPSPPRYCPCCGAQFTKYE